MRTILEVIVDVVKRWPRDFLSSKSVDAKPELVIAVKLSNNIISFSDILCGLEKVIVTVDDPLVVVNALVSVVVDLIGCMS